MNARQRRKIAKRWARNYYGDENKPNWLIRLSTFLCDYCDFFVEEGKEMIGRKGVTKHGFGGLLKDGIPAVVIRQQGEDITIRIQYGNIYHGKVMDFVLDEKEGGGE